MNTWSTRIIIGLGLLAPIHNAVGNTVSGTGFFISSTGYIATNHHVINNAIDIKVKDWSGQTRDAEVVLTDAANDLAVLRVAGDGFLFIPIRPSSDLMKGATVFTIGFPNTRIQGFESKVTQGIVSSLSGISGEPNSFQISVPVQPGNSGGPLLDTSGAVVGVVTAKLSATAMLKTTGTLPENVNYAIKSNYLIELANTNSLVAKGLLKSDSYVVAPLPSLVTKAEKAVVLIIANTRPNAKDAQSAQNSDRPKEWKSLESSATRRLMITDTTVTGGNNIPPEHVSAGGYSNWDFTRTDDIWKGKYFDGRPCRTSPGFFKPSGIKVCKFVSEAELSMVTPNRMEGRVIFPPHGSKLDCDSCKFDMEMLWRSFVWIPNE